VNASLPTHTAYPDSSSTPCSGTDLVKRESDRDGQLKKLTDQLGSVTTWGQYIGSTWSLQHQAFDGFGNRDGVVDGADWTSSKRIMARAARSTPATSTTGTATATT
jgi:hypothetical protein